jgi:hypothetical protein
VIRSGRRIRHDYYSLEEGGDNHETRDGVRDGGEVMDGVDDGDKAKE